MKKDTPKGIHISNNLLAVLAILFALCSLVSTTLVYVETGPYLITGKSVNEANVTIIILGTAPSVHITRPPSCEVITGIAHLNATVQDENGDTTIANVSFYYKLGYGGSDWVYIGSDYYDNDIHYNLSWQTNSLTDSIYYQIMVLATDVSNLTGQDTSGYFAINNINTEPGWEPFKFNTSTNLSLLLEWGNISGLCIGNSYGFINFTGTSVNIDGLNLALYINISDKKISFDPSSLPCLNLPAYLHFLNVNMNSPRVIRDGSPCSGAICTLISNNRRDVVVRVTGFSTYELSDNVNFEMWDITDPNRSPGNQTRYKNQQTQFYVNLSSGGLPYNNSHTKCYIWFNTTGFNFIQMEFRQTKLYEYTRNFSSPYTYTWRVICNSTLDQYMNIDSYDSILISNRPPRLKAILPNITMEEDTTALYINDLDDYFEDLEGDTMTYNVSSVPNVRFTVLSKTILITPNHNWYGNRTFVVYATDQYGLMNQSNIIRLTVIDMPEPVSTPSEPGGGSGASGGGGGAGRSGGGGGGSYNPDEFKESPNCIDNWTCSAWTACEYRWADPGQFNISNQTISPINKSETDGIRTRVCFDEHHCNYYWKKPNETEYCKYQPSCIDHIKNQGELGVDCLGPCPPCESCNDGIKNQAEEGIDCGGPCPACANCNDGIKNCQGQSCEEGIDCGGPCARTCPKEEKPAVMVDLYTLSILLLLLIVSLFTLYLFLRPYAVRIYLFFLALKTRKAEKPAPSLIEIETRYLLLLQKLRKKAANGDITNLSAELNLIFKKFLCEAYEIKTEITFEELIKYTRNQKIPAMLKLALSTYMGEIIKIEYGKLGIDRNDFISRIDRAKELFDMVTRNRPKSPEKQPVEKKQKATPSPSEPHDNLIKVYKLLVEAKRNIIKKDIDTARRLEQDIKNLYKTLNREEKKKLGKDFAQLKEEIKTLNKKRDKK